MSRSDTLKARICSGKPVFGTFVKNNCPNLAEMLGWAGFDFAILDCEHSSYSYGELEHMIRACHLADIASIARIACPEPWQVHHGPESGATGVQIPSIRSVENAAECAQDAVFFPGGTCSPNPSLRAGQYGCWIGEKSYLESKAESSLCVVQVESIAMANAVEDLCQIPQIDVLFVGPGDLSMSMGKPGRLNDPEVASVIEAVIRRELAGGFGSAGFPTMLYEWLYESGCAGLNIITSGVAPPDKPFQLGFAGLLRERRIRSLTLTHAANNPEVGRQKIDGTLQVEAVPQGAFVERIRAGGAGLGGVLTPTGIGTPVAQGKQVLHINGRDYLLELPIRADLVFRAEMAGKPMCFLRDLDGVLLEFIQC